MRSIQSLTDTGSHAETHRFRVILPQMILAVLDWRPLWIGSRKNRQWNKHPQARRAPYNKL
ncbi:MAG: hypothetical protein ACON46_03440 [Coraliomargaritaceae bacterium]